MINKKKIGAFVLAGTMLLSMGTTVFAAGEPTVPNVNQNGQVPITKDFEMADGLATPNVTFKFTATSETPDALPAMIEDISYAAGDKGTLKDEKYVISKDTAISFQGTWSHVGEYVYTVTETQDPANKVENVTYDSSEYTLRVYVVNKNDNLEVEKITAEKAGTKTAKILFKNTYAKKDATLIIEKNTTGTYANKTQQFDFTIAFTKSPTESTLGEFKGTITRKGNNTSEPVITNNGSYNFKLADGDKLQFTDLPVGTTYVVTENGAKDDYTPSVTVIENAQETVKDRVAQNEEQALSTQKENGEKNLIGENTNKVTFTNTYKNVAVTGVIMNNLPFILLVAVAIVAFVSLAVMKRHIRSEKQRKTRRKLSGLQIRW